MKASFRLSVGGWSVDSAADPRTELLAADVRRRLDATADSCRLQLYAPPPPPADLLGQAMAAASSALGLGGAGAGPSGPSVPVRGVDLKHGDPVSLELTAGDITATVLTGTVQSFEVSLTTLSLVARTGAQQLADTRINQVYENQRTSAVVDDVLGQLGLVAGDVAEGRTWPYLVLDESRSVGRHLLELAAREGADLWFDAENQLCLRPFTASAADHVLHYGIDILDLRLRRSAPGTEVVHAYGESPASSQGTDAWPWLVKDLAPLGGTSGTGARRRYRSDSALRTKDAADGRAAAQLGAATDATSTGRVTLLGRPDIGPAQAVEIKGAPQPSLNGLFKVTGVRHHFGKRTGFVTLVDLAGQGGAAGGGAGDLLGAAAGAVGL